MKLIAGEILAFAKLAFFEETAKDRKEVFVFLV